MISFDQSIPEAFPLIQQLLLDSFQLESNLFSYPYENIELFDHGFRTMVWNHYETPTLTASQFGATEDLRVYIIKSTLGFYNVIACITKGECPDFIGTAPFCDKKLSVTAINQLFKGNSYSPDFIRLAQTFYHELPVANPNDVVTFLLHLFTAFCPDFATITPEFINYSDEKHTIIPNSDTMLSFNQRHATIYASHLNRYLNAVADGNLTETSGALTKLITSKKITPTSPISDIKKSASELNTLCKGKLLSASVHPFYVLRLFQHYDASIQSATYSERIIQIVTEMSRKYCLLVNNYGFSHYSYLVRNVINYIALQLDEELSLSVIANEFHKNASFLSTQFKKETGKSITDWIHEQRIKEALRYFNTTELSVSEVALKVGIHDFAYFSKLFKKQIGQTPNSYRKMMRRSEN